MSSWKGVRIADLARTQISAHACTKSSGILRGVVAAPTASLGRPTASEPPNPPGCAETHARWLLRLAQVRGPFPAMDDRTRLKGLGHTGRRRSDCVTGGRSSGAGRPARGRDCPPAGVMQGSDRLRRGPVQFSGRPAMRASRKRPTGWKAVWADPSGGRRGTEASRSSGAGSSRASPPPTRVPPPRAPRPVRCTEGRMESTGTPHLAIVHEVQAGPHQLPARPSRGIDSLSAVNLALAPSPEGPLAREVRELVLLALLLFAQAATGPRGANKRIAGATRAALPSRHCQVTVRPPDTFSGSPGS